MAHHIKSTDLQLLSGATSTDMFEKHDEISALSEMAVATMPDATVEPTFTKWQDLDETIFDILFKFMLVSEEPITNPFTWSTQRKKKSKTESKPVKDGYSAESRQKRRSQKTASVSYSWPKYLRPALLATCKAYHSKGMKYLYGQNTFRFTRLMGQSGPEDWSVFVGTSSIASDVFSDFLTVKHKSLPNHPTRMQLIRKLTLEDTEFGTTQFPDFPAKEQLFREHLNDNMAWQFYMLNRVENLGANLTQLTLTLDENEPVVFEHINSETENRKFRTAQRLLKNPKNEDSAARRSVVIERLFVRGTSQFSSDEMRTRLEDGSLQTSNSSALMLEKWIAGTEIRFPDSTETCPVPPKRVVYLGKLQ